MTAMTATTARAALVRTLAALLTTATLVAVPAGGATAADDRAERWAGFRIPSTGHAAGGWIGGYRVGRTPVFVITPERRPNRAGFRAADPTNDLQGRRGPSRRDTQRAAWILSRYGGHRDATQAAAVDAAVLHLLGDRAWRVGEARGAARVRASGDPATVRRFVRLMLRGSRVSAGRYRAVVLPTTADVGGVTSVTVRVTDGHGGPVSGLPVTVTSPDGGASQPAAGPIDAVTGDDGRAVVRLAAPLAGWRTVVARVGQVPEHRLRVRGPDGRGQAAVAEGGVRRTIVVSALAAVRGPQSLSLKAPTAPLIAGQETSVTATIAGDGTTRAASAVLYGPFAASSEGTCSGASTGSVSAAVGADGSYTLPALRPSAGGYYVWGVVVDGTAVSMPVAACSTPVRVRSLTTTGVTSDAATLAPGEVGATGTVIGLPFPAQATLTGTLYGPYGSELERAADNCGAAGEAATRTRTGNGSVHFTVEALAPGYYAWRATTLPGELWLGSSSTCLAPGTNLRVQ